MAVAVGERVALGDGGVVAVALRVGVGLGVRLRVGGVRLRLRVWERVALRRLDGERDALGDVPERVRVPEGVAVPLPDAEADGERVTLPLPSPVRDAVGVRLAVKGPDDVGEGLAVDGEAEEEAEGLWGLHVLVEEAEGEVCETEREAVGVRVRAGLGVRLPDPVGGVAVGLRVGLADGEAGLAVGLVPLRLGLGVRVRVPSRVAGREGLALRLRERDPVARTDTEAVSARVAEDAEGVRVRPLALSEAPAVGVRVRVEALHVTERGVGVSRGERVGVGVAVTERAVLTEGLRVAVRVRDGESVLGAEAVGEGVGEGLGAEGLGVVAVAVLDAGDPVCAAEAVGLREGL